MTTLTKDGRGFVCAKHNEFAANGICRWCEPVKEEMRAAAPHTASYTCQMTSIGRKAPCGAPAVWDWTAASETARQVCRDAGVGDHRYFCNKCHTDIHDCYAGTWAWTAIDHPWNAAPQETP